MNETARDRRPGRWARRAGALAVAGALMLLAPGCGGSTASSPPAGTASGNSVTAAYTARLAFVRCVHAHGVPNYPDPDSNGKEPAGTQQVFVNDPRFPAAAGACRHLLPSGGQPAQAPKRDARTTGGALRLARCMRTHGYPSFPDPTIDSAGQPVFNVQAAGIPPHSPQVLATLRGCLSRLHLTGLPSTGS